MKIKFIKGWLQNRSQGKNKDGGKTRQGEKHYMFQCSVPKEFCKGSHNGKIQAIVHGSMEGAKRCYEGYRKILAQGEA